MPRLKSNRWWTLILTLCVLAALTSFHRASADTIRGTTGYDNPVYGSSPPPTAAGDPDQPVPSSLKYSQRGSLGSRNAPLTLKAAGDSRYVGNVWTLRLSELMRALRISLIRY